MTYDPQLGQIVLFGGQDGLGGELLSDTWTFDGHDWTERHPSRAPPARVSDHENCRVLITKSAEASG